MKTAIIPSSSFPNFSTCHPVPERERGGSLGHREFGQSERASVQQAPQPRAGERQGTAAHRTARFNQTIVLQDEPVGHTNGTP